MMQCMQFSWCFTLRSNRDCDEMWDTESWQWGLVSCISENGQHLWIWWIGYLQHLNVIPNIQNMIFWCLLLLWGKWGRTVVWAHGSIHSPLSQKYMQHAHRYESTYGKHKHIIEMDDYRLKSSVPLHPLLCDVTRPQQVKKPRAVDADRPITFPLLNLSVISVTYR